MSDNLVIWLQGESYKIDTIDDFQDKFFNHIYFSYKKNFEPFKGTDITSDSGWGCTLRCAQMILHQSLMTLDKNYNWRGLFLDDYNSTFSIHNLCKYKKINDIEIKEWVGPSFASNLLKYALMDSKYKKHFDIEIAKDTMIIKKNYSIPTIIFVPLRLGLTQIEPIYYHYLYILFTYGNFIGFIGGSNFSAYYFVAIDSELQLYYLDPHLTQDLKKEVKYTSDIIKKIHICEIDPNLSLCFVCNTSEELNNFYKMINDSILPIGIIDEIQSINDLEVEEENDWMLLT